MMRRLLLDSNIIIDALAHREPYDDSARLLLALGKVREFELWMSASQMTDVFYVLTEGGKPSRNSWGKEALVKLREAIHVCSIGESEIDSALASTWDDIEDACVHEAALKIHADALITRNKKDFERSSVCVFDCEELLEFIRRESGISYAEIMC